MRFPPWMVRLARDAGLLPTLRAREVADRARDRGDWVAAARLYPLYLARRPDDWGVWVQLGNVQKDTGDPVSAEASYRRAMALAPGEGDPPLQLGHALRMQRRLSEAREAFALAARLGERDRAERALAELAIDIELGRAAPGTPREEGARAALAEARRAAAARPGDADAARALAEALVEAGEAAEAAEAAARAWALRPDRAAFATARRCGAEFDEAEGAVFAPLLLDVGDLLNFLEETGRVTGIQRVQLGLIEGVLGDPARRADALFCFLDQPGDPIWALSHDDAEAILRRCLEAKPDPAAARELTAAARGRARAARLAGARAHVFAGNFWYPADGGRALRRALRAHGVRGGALVYDLIPVTHPEHMPLAVAAHFRRGLESHAPGWDFALTISRHTARDLARAMAALGVDPPPPIRPVPLAHRLNARREPPGGGAGGAWPEELADLRGGGGFVLCVGTLESRKNHRALLQAWALLRDEAAAAGAAPPPPPLVLVGRPGWLVQDLLEQLAASRGLGGLVRVLHDVSDAELDALYRACLFTVFPSFTEGWGLPVGESLAAGKLCLASTEGAVPEAGEGFADPVDPYDARALARRVRHWSTDRAALAEAERRIAEGFRPRGWPEVAADFLAALEECAAAPAASRPEPPAPEIAPGAALRARDPKGLAVIERALEGPLGGSQGGGAGETVWIAGRAARLRLRAPEDGGRVVARFDSVPWAEGNALRATTAATAGAGGRELRCPVVASRPVFLVLPSGEVDAALAVEGPLLPVGAAALAEPRPIRLGLSGLRHLPGPLPELPEAEPLRFGEAREAEAGGVDSWRAHCLEGFGHAVPGGVLVAGAARLALRPRLSAPGRVRAQLAFRLGEGASEGALSVSLGDARAEAAPGPLAAPALLAVEAEARPGETLELRVAPPGGGRECALVAAQWIPAGAGLEGRLRMLEALLGPPAAAGGLGGGGGGAAGRVEALEAALGAPGQPGARAARLAALRRRPPAAAARG